jgi:uncharacterized membrane protein
MYSDISLIIKTYLILIAILFILDLIWLTLMNKRFYQKELKNILKEKIDYIPALIFYLIYPLGLSFFVVIPTLFTNTNNELGQAFLFGAIFGLICYSTYDLTNASTMKNWSNKVTIVDLTWGTFLSAISSGICFAVIRFA